jgi:1,2-phenylacetyl-CoA epoxidase catalytic subunit
MRCLDQHFGGWLDFVAVNVVVDTALTTVLSAAVDSPYEPLRQRARKIVQEEAAHWVHGAGWLRRLAREGGQAGLVRAMDHVWPDAMTWFGQADDPTLAPLVTAGLLTEGPEALRGRFTARLSPLLDQAGLSSVMQRASPWDRWDPTARRLN